jgi:hypothetical protein
VTVASMGGEMRRTARGDASPLSGAGDDALDRDVAAGRHELYRAVNTNIVALVDRFNAGLPESMFQVCCECGRSECTEMISLRRDEYESARVVATHFLAATGHALPNVERVVLDKGRYTVVELVSETPPGSRPDNRRRKGKR